MDSWFPIVAIAGFILLNGLFVAAEFAIVGSSRSSIEHLAQKGRRIARSVLEVLEHPLEQDRFIATAQIGITFASLGLGMYGEHTVANWIAELLEDYGTEGWLAAHAIGSATAVAILTYFHIVIGEMVPKSVALQYPEITALRVARPMRWLERGLYPLVMTLNGLGNLVLRGVGVDRKIVSTEHYYTPEDLEFLVGESQRLGLIGSESGDVLRELFEFGELTAAKVMVPRVQMSGLPLSATRAEVEAIVRSTRHTRYPVYTDDLDHIVGMVHIKDLLRLWLQMRTLEAGDVRPVPYVPETARLDAVLAVLRREGSQLAIVLDEHGGTAGLITVQDVGEEIVGQVERAGATPDIHQDAFGRLRVAGTVRIAEVGERLGIELEHADVDSVSGLVLAQLDRPPLLGDIVEYRGVRFQVTAVAGHGVRECTVEASRPERR